MRPLTIVAAFVALWVVLLGFSVFARNLDPLPAEPGPPTPVPPDNAWDAYARAITKSIRLAPLGHGGDPNVPGHDLVAMREEVEAARPVFEAVEGAEAKPLVIDQSYPSYWTDLDSPPRGSPPASDGSDLVRMNPHRLVFEYGRVTDAFVLRGDLALAEGRIQATLDSYKAALRFTARLKSSGGVAPYIGACLAEARVLRRLAGLAARLDPKQTENLGEVMGKQLAASTFEWAWQREAALGERWLYRLMRDDRNWQKRLAERGKAQDPSFQADVVGLRRADALTAYRVATGGAGYGTLSGNSPSPAPTKPSPSAVAAMLPLYREEDSRIASANRAEMSLLALAVAAKRHLAARGTPPPSLRDAVPYLPRRFAVPTNDPFLVRFGTAPPLRMSILSDGTVAFWSVGPDGKDDGGRVWLSAGAKPRGAETYDPTRGDVTVLLRPDGRMEFASSSAASGPSTSLAPNSRKVAPGP
ncbi:MAG: hypothetical protein KIS66_12425 [Fimbriimonadaceae bacterium]|nr:hypothetical protein [Fimbriimonadaceae bacterium]